MKFSKQIKRWTALALTVVLMVSSMVINASAAEMMYSFVRENYSTKHEAAILKSGALDGDFEMDGGLTYPSEALVVVDQDAATVKAEEKETDLGTWVPVTYQTNVTDKSEFDGAVGELPESGYNRVDVVYELELDSSIEREILPVLNLPYELKAEFDVQKEQMDALYARKGTLESLDLAIFEILEMIMDENDPDEGALLDALAYLSENHMNDEGKLTLCDMIDEYDADGMLYYYRDYLAIQDEVEGLSGAMDGLVDKQDVLRNLIAEMKGLKLVQNNPDLYEMVLDAEEKVDRISEVTDLVTEVKEGLTAPHEAIILGSAKLSKLVEALEEASDVNEYEEVPALTKAISVEVTNIISINVTITLDGDSEVLSVEAGEEPDQAAMAKAVAAMKELVADYIAEELDTDVDFYTNDYENGAELDALIENIPDSTVSYEYTWTPKTYTVVFEGEDELEPISFTFSSNMRITLPSSTEAGIRYDYKVNGVSYESGARVKFEKADLARFVDGVYTVTFEKVDEIAEKMNGFIASLESALGKGSVSLEAGTLKVKLASIEDMMSFAMALYNPMGDSSYDYIALDENVLKDGTALYLQSLVDAVLNSDFDQDTIIALGKNGKGKLIETTMQLGDDESAIEQDLNLVMEMSSVPSEIAGLAGALESAKSYLQFEANAGAMDVTLTLPEKIYEVYLAALLATGGVDKTDINDVDEAVAYSFFEDCVNVLLGEDVTATTYANTLAKLGREIDQDYLDLLASVSAVLKYETGEEDGDAFVLNLSKAGGKSSLTLKLSADGIGLLVNQIGGDGMDMFLGAIQEYKSGDGLVIPATITVTNFNTATNYEAIVIDINAVKAPGTMDKLNVVDCTNDLAARLAKVTGYAAVMLQKDINGDLDFSKAGTVILDLNGNDVNGSIIAGDSLIIVDSSMGTKDCGTVTGSVSGNVIIVSGTYSADVSAYLKDGYIQKNGTVQNKLYTIDVDSEGNITYNVNASKEIMELYSKDGALALAMDIASDLALNYYVAAGLDMDGNSIYSIDAFDDLVDLYADYKAEGATATLNEILGMLHLDKVSATDGGVEGFVNMVLADLMDFQAIATALQNKTPVVTYDMSIRPWKLNVDRHETEDYFVFGITAGKAETVSVSLKIDGAYAEDLQKLTAALAGIKNAAKVTVDLENLTYANKTVTVSGKVSEVVLDLDMTKSEYPTVIAVILANAGVKKAEFVNAIKANDEDAIQAAFNEVTVKQVLDAMKDLGLGVDFAAMAKKLGVSNADAEALENAYHAFLVLGGEALERLSIYGPNTKMGAFDTDKDGVYAYAKGSDAAPLKTINRRVGASGYAVDLNLGVTKIDVKINLFKEATSDDDGPSGGGGGGGAEKHTSYLTGYADGSLKPYDGITRGQVATIFFRLLSNSDRTKYWSQTNDFSDCSADLWCNNAISTLANMGIIDGYQDGTFRPNAKITRAQFAKIALGYFKATEKSYQGTFSDVAADAWYCSYVEGAAAAGLVQGFEDGTYRPNAYITRAQACVIVNRALGRNPHEDYLLEKSELMTWTDCDSDDWFYADMMEATHSHSAKWMSVKGERIEKWSKKLPQPDWSALEHSWSTANSAKK